MAPRRNSDCGPQAEPNVDGAERVPPPPALLTRRESWTLRLYSPALAEKLGFLSTPKDEMARGLAGRNLVLSFKDPGYMGDNKEARAAPAGAEAAPRPSESLAKVETAACGCGRNGPAAGTSRPAPRRLG